MLIPEFLLYFIYLQQMNIGIAPALFTWNTPLNSKAYFVTSFSPECAKVVSSLLRHGIFFIVLNCNLWTDQDPSSWMLFIMDQFLDDCIMAFM